jgi:hypothetical protein
MDLWALRVDVCRAGDTVPILSHVFFGADKEQVDAAFKLHMEDDEFLRVSYEDGEVRGVRVSIVVKYVKPLEKRKAANG